MIAGEKFLNVAVFDGSLWRSACTVVVDGTAIRVEGGELSENLQPAHQADKLLVPAFVDVQVYGRAGRLFAQYPDSENLAALANENEKGGTATCLVTIATQPLEVVIQCVKAVKNYIQQGGKGISGMHLEGPFIHAEKRGAHKKEWVIEPTIGMAEEILYHAEGCLKMVTLAPECCSQQVIDRFVQAGVVVSAGHTALDFDAAMQLHHRHVHTVTHLFNAMNPIHHRAPGLPVAVMQNNQLNASVIADGIHVHYHMVQLAAQQMKQRLFYITDAVAGCDEGPYLHQWAGDRFTLPDGTLSGSGLHMHEAVYNGWQHAGIGLEDSLRMASLYPARLMGWEAHYGSFSNGKQVCATLVDAESFTIQQLYRECLIQFVPS